MYLDWSTISPDALVVDYFISSHPIAHDLAPISVPRASCRVPSPRRTSRPAAELSSATTHMDEDKFILSDTTVSCPARARSAAGCMTGLYSLVQDIHTSRDILDLTQKVKCQ